MRTTYLLLVQVQTAPLDSESLISQDMWGPGDRILRSLSCTILHDSGTHRCRAVCSSWYRYTGLSIIGSLSQHSLLLKDLTTSSFGRIFERRERTRFTKPFVKDRRCDEFWANRKTLPSFRLEVLLSKEILKLRQDLRSNFSGANLESS